MRLRRRHEMPGLNATATADISFILLIFFLVTSSMDADKGIARQLPPKQEQKEAQPTTVESADLLALTIRADGSIAANDTTVATSELPARIGDFLLRRGADHLITIDTAPDAAYDAYFLLTNAIVGAYRAERNRLAQQRFGTDFEKLDADRRTMILDLCPQRVAENYELQNPPE